MFTRSLVRRLVALAAAGATVLPLASVGTTPTPAGASGPQPVLSGYVPLPADDLVTALTAINSAADTTLDFTVGITSAGAGAVIVYDHWEDGFEADLTNPVQSTTRVWGDGNTGNGNAATVCGTCGGDLVPQGAVFVLRNDVATPRNPGTVLYDGRDKVASTRGFALTAAGWTTPLGSVLASAVSAYDTSKYGTDFVVPVGQDTAVPSGASPAFEYTAASVMAAAPGTVVRVDLEGNGSVDQTVTLGEGEAHLFNGGLLEGARITSSLPIQVDIITGDVNAVYESRSFFLFPTELLTNDYVSPVGTSTANQDTVVYLHNPAGASLVVTPTCTGCSGTIILGPGGTSAFLTPAGQAVRFQSASGTTFSAIAAIGAHSGGVGAGSDAGSSWDWGYTLVPTRMLTTQVVLGWAPGNSAIPPTAADDDPVWVSTMADTTLRIDYDGDPSTGALGPDCYGMHDVEQAVTALASNRLTDTSDKDMTGARIYTCDGTPVVGAWGEDPANAPSGSPGLDAGYTLIPSTTMVVDKTAVVATDADGDGRPGPGDTLEYRVEIADAGSLAFTGVEIHDPLGAGMTYVPGSSVIVSGGITTPIADDVLGGAATVFPFDEAPFALPDLAAGASYEVRYEVTVASPFPAGVAGITNAVEVTANEDDAYDQLTTLMAANDVSVAVTRTGTPTHVGDNIVWVVTVTNAGPDAATAVTVDAPVPAGTTLVSSTASTGTWSSGTGDWAVGSLASGASATLSITTSADTTSSTLYAEVIAAGGVDVDSRPAENTFDAGHAADQDDEDDLTTTVAALVDLSLTKHVVAGPDNAGITTFRLTLTNDGPSTATGIVVTDIPAGGTTQGSATASTGTFNAGAHTWTVPSLASGASATLDLVQTVTAFPSTHHAQVTAHTEDDLDSQPAENALGGANAPDQDDEDSVQVVATASTAGEVWLDLDADGTKDAGEPGVDGVTVTVRYAGPDDTFGTGDDVSTPVTTASDGTWASTGLTPGSYRVLVDPVSLPFGATSPTYDVDGVGTPQVAAFTLAPGASRSDVHFGEAGTSSLAGTVFADADRDGTLDPGEGRTGVTVRVVWNGPDGVAGNGDDASLATTTAADGTWTIGALPSGGHRVVIDRTTAPADLTLVTADPDSTLDAATVVTLAAGQARTGLDVGLAREPVRNLAVTVTPPATAAVGAPATFQVTIRSTVDDVPGPITLTTTLPANLSFVSGGSADWTCSAVGQVVTCTHAGMLAGGVSSELPITTNVLSSAAVRLTVEVDGAGDVSPVDDTAAASVQPAGRLPRTGGGLLGQLLLAGGVLVVIGALDLMVVRVRRRRPVD